MSSVPDPIRRVKRFIHATMVGGAAAVVACAVWAFSPLSGLTALQKLEPVDAAPAPEPTKQQSIDLQVFTAKLWNPPPAAPKSEVAKAPEPPKPLNLQLIGIIYEADNIRKAALYDMDSDRLLILGNGDQIRNHTVKAITELGIELTDGRSTHRIILKQEPS